MPYTQIDELPSAVKDHLPKHAQEVFKETYNNAWKEYADADKRDGNEGHEEVAMKVAWSAVKKAGYEKGPDDQWQKAE